MASSLPPPATALVFATLDPILKGLLAELTALKETIDDESAVAPSGEDPRPRPRSCEEATLVRRFRTIVESLEALSASLRSLALPLPERNGEERDSESGAGLVRNSNSNSNNYNYKYNNHALDRHRCEQRARSLRLLADYVTLPLTAIFHLPLREICDGERNATANADANARNGGGTRDGDRAEWRRRLRIRRSYVFRVYRSAASAIQTYVEATSTTLQTNTDTNINTKANTNTKTEPSSPIVVAGDDRDGAGIDPGNLLPSDTRIKYLVALIHSMPSFSEVHETRTSTMPNASAAAATATATPSLDDGTESWVAILEATRSLLATFARSDAGGAAASEAASSDGDLGSGSGSGIHGDKPDPHPLLEAWHGTLAMRLVDCLTAFLADTNHRGNVNGSSNNNNNVTAPVFSPPVRRAALAALGLLLEITTATATAATKHGSASKGTRSSPLSLSPSPSPPSVSFWRAVFPGVFAALYPRVADDGRRPPSGGGGGGSRASSSPAVELRAASLDSLIGLLRVTLTTTNPSTDSVREDRDGESGADGFSDADNLLARLTSMAATANANANANANAKPRAHDRSSSSSSSSSRNLIQSGGDSSKSRPPNRSGKESRDDGNDNDNNDGDGDDDRVFFSKVKERVEGPLLGILRRLSVSPSDAIRRRVVRLCGVLLLETEDRAVWRSGGGGGDTDADADDDSSGAAFAMPSATVVGRVCFELCIGFRLDPDAAVRESSGDIAERYVRQCHPSALPSSLASPSPTDWMVPRTIELIQGLAALVHKGEDATISSSRVRGVATAMELRTELNLAAGYLQCLEEYTNRHGEVAFSARTKRSSGCADAGESITGGAMATQTAETTTATKTANSASVCSALLSSKHLRQSLIQLFDVDFESWKENKTNVVSVVTDPEEATNSRVKLRYLDRPDLMCLARDSILRTLGKLLGPKHGALFVDGVVSDFIEASFHMPGFNSSNQSSDDSYICWLHEWIGSLIVAREVLAGAFSAPTVDTRASTSSRKSKKQKRRNRILHSLASSILPLLVDSSVWRLPTENRVPRKTNTITNNIDLLSQQTLQTNSIVVVLLMELIGVFSKVLERDTNNFLTHILYPIVDKTIRGGSVLSSDTIQSTGLSTLKIVTHSCGLQNMEDLIYIEHNQLVAAMVGRLRVPGGPRNPKVFNEADDVFCVAKIAIWMMERMIKRIEQGYKERARGELDSLFDPIQATKSTIVDLISLLDYRLDHLFLQKTLNDADIETICSLHKVFYEYFLQLFDVKRDRVYSYKMKNADQNLKLPWMDLFSQFRRNDMDLPDIEDEEAMKVDEGVYLDLNKMDITLFAKLVARGCYLLSYKNLTSRVSSCKALTSAFKFLSFVGSEHDDPTDDTNLIRNTVLRQVAESWPSIRARLKTLSSEVGASSSIDNSSVALVLNQSTIKTQRRSFNSEDLGVKRIFLANLFELIAIMCQCSGDFFADRFRHDVWPVMACHLENILKKLHRQREASSVSFVSPSQPIKHELSELKVENTKFDLGDTERQLIVSILMCLNRVIEQKECGRAVEKLLGSIGFALLPFVDIQNHNRIQEVSLDCIRSIMRIDCDVLRRPLMELSGTRIPTCLEQFRKTENFSLVPNKAAFPCSGGSKAITHQCEDLLKYANSLPEQAI